MTSKDNVDLTRRVFEDVWNGKQRDRIDEYFDEGMTSHGYGVEEGDLDAYKTQYDTISGAFPDIEFELGEVFGDETRSAATWVASGTHEGELMGVEPTGNASSVSGISVHKHEGDKIVEAWTSYDSLRMMQNVEAVPEMMPADD